MEDYRKSSHAIYRCEYHFVWVPKYRYQVLIVKEIKPRLKEILIELCEWLDVTDHGGRHMLPDHIHMYLIGSPEALSSASDEGSQRVKALNTCVRDFPELD